MDEAPENTLAAVRHAWTIPGAVPEVDVRSTLDSVLICLHDSSLARTTNAPASIRNRHVKDIPYAQIENLDAGSSFSEKYSGEKIPTLENIFRELVADTSRQIYLDVKCVNLSLQEKQIDKYDVESKIIFVNGDPSALVALKTRFPTARTMTWLGGDAKEIKRKYEEYKEDDFKGIDQLQFHLKTKEGDSLFLYLLDNSFLAKAKTDLERLGRTIQVRPFDYNNQSLKCLLDLGIRWYVTDAPEKFYHDIQTALH